MVWQQIHLQTSLGRCDGERAMVKVRAWQVQNFMFCVFIQIFISFSRFPGNHSIWGSLQFGLVLGFGDGVVADPYSTDEPRHCFSWSVFFFCTGLKWLSHFAWFPCKLRREKESLLLFSPHKVRQECFAVFSLENLQKPSPSRRFGRFQFKSGHLVSCVLQDSEIRLCTDVKEFRKAPTSTLLHALW